MLTKKIFFIAHVTQSNDAAKEDNYSLMWSKDECTSVQKCKDIQLRLNVAAEGFKFKTYNFKTYSYHLNFLCHSYRSENVSIRLHHRYIQNKYLYHCDLSSFLAEHNKTGQAMEYHHYHVSNFTVSDKNQECNKKHHTYYIPAHNKNFIMLCEIMV
jgi:hypothetical protein